MKLSLKPWRPKYLAGMVLCYWGFETRMEVKIKKMRTTLYPMRSMDYPHSWPPGSRETGPGKAEGKCATSKRRKNEGETVACARDLGRLMTVFLHTAKKTAEMKPGE